MGGKGCLISFGLPRYPTPPHPRPSAPDLPSLPLPAPFPTWAPRDAKPERLLQLSSTLATLACLPALPTVPWVT